jgi:hypothetical protein
MCVIFSLFVFTFESKNVILNLDNKMRFEFGTCHFWSAKGKDEK